MAITARLPKFIDYSRVPDDGEERKHSAKDSAPHFLAPAIPLSGFVPEPPSMDELQLVQRVFFLSSDKAPRVVVFCGVEAGDGAEAVCARAAEVLSCLVSETICIVDANLRAPTIHLRYELNAHPACRLQTDGNEEDGPLRGPNLWILPAAELKECRLGLAPELMRHRLNSLREKFGFLLICAPPLGAAAEGFVLGQMADGVVLNVMARSTLRTTAARVRHNLELYKVRLLGAVLNERSARPGCAHRKEQS